MSVDAPPRATEAIPYAESQPQRAIRHASPDWLPVIGWFVDDGLRHSRINVVPLAQYRRSERALRGDAQVFPRRRAAGAHLHLASRSPAIRSSDTRARSCCRRWANRRSRGWSRSPPEVWTTRRRHFPWVDSWLEFSADDGSLSGSVPGFVFKGGTTKRVMSGKWQHWPGVAANASPHDICFVAQLPSSADGGAAGSVRAVGTAAEL